MRLRASSSSSSNSTVTGSRPTNSGINPYFCRSSGSTHRIISSPVSSRSSPVKPICLFPRRASTILSSPSNAPPQIKRMFLVLTWIYSCCGCFRPPCGGTDATVPSSIFRSACWTPSPETSLVIEGFSDLRAILSISSM